MRTSVSSITRTKHLSSGPFESLVGQQRSKSLVTWRPVLAVCCGLLCYLTVRELANSFLWSADYQLTISLLLSFVLIFPTCLVESRGRCLVGLAPSLCFLEPFTTWWVIYVVAASSLAIGWWLRHQELRAVPSGLKQRQLSKQLSRYPLLHQSSLELARTQTAQQVADTLVEQAMRLAMSSLAAGVYIGFQNEPPTLRSRQGIFPKNIDDQADDPFIQYVATEKCAAQQRNGAQLRLLLPLIPEHSVHKGHIGILDIIVAHNTQIDDYNVELTQALAVMGSIALGTSDIIHETRSLAIRDDLTNLLGQQEFCRRSKEALAQCQRHGQPASLLLCDLDYLKKFNDTYGHASGDQALKAIADILHQLREHNEHVIVGRWGGEEFVIFCINTKKIKAQAIAESVITAVRAVTIDGHHITTSIGLAEWLPGDSFEELLQQADQACYRAKELGRDRLYAQAKETP